MPVLIAPRVFRSVDPAYGTDVVPSRPELYGGWGLVGRHRDGQARVEGPSLLGATRGDVLAYTSSVDARAGISGLLTRRDPRTFVAFVSNFVATGGEGRRVVLRLEGAARGRGRYLVKSLDGTVRRTQLASRGVLVVPIDIEAQTAVLVELRATRTA